MKPLNNSTIFYSPDPVPSDINQVQMYLENELLKIKRIVELLALGHLEVTYVAPLKPRKGDLRYADGTSWNPGSGEGVYRYSGSAWVSLG